MLSDTMSLEPECVVLPFHSAFNVKEPVAGGIQSMLYPPDSSVVSEVIGIQDPYSGNV